MKKYACLVALMLACAGCGVPANRTPAQQMYWNKQADIWGGAVRDIGRIYQRSAEERSRIHQRAADQILQRRPMSCTSTRVGMQTFTNCY